MIISYLFVWFERKEDYKHVLEGGPWVIGGHYLTVRQWSPNLNPVDDSFKKLIAWIRLPSLPMEYYNPLALAKMGAIVGPGKSCMWCGRSSNATGSSFRQMRDM